MSGQCSCEVLVDLSGFQLSAENGPIETGYLGNLTWSLRGEANIRRFCERLYPRIPSRLQQDARVNERGITAAVSKQRAR